jgi:hypothetical protein
MTAFFNLSFTNRFIGCTFKVARYLLLYLIDFVKFVFILQEKHLNKRKQPKNKGRITFILLNNPVKQVYPY